MLTSYDGTTISYDTIGNPANWRGMVGLSWNGRQLSGIEIDGISEELTFKYNADGIRTKKTYYDEDGYLTVHKYILDGNKIVKETVTGNSAYTLYYLYDAAGSIAGLEYNGTTYYFQKNLQGDIIRICNISGNTVVEYTYDAWGKVLSITGSQASTLGQINPFRYRGYYYDVETEFYYLQTRYYDPEVGRFINADGYVSTGQGIIGNNMFAYCNNNPVNAIDPKGLFFEFLKDPVAYIFKIINKVLGFEALPTSRIGAAGPYVDLPGSNDPNSPNCYSYAIGSPVDEQPGRTSGRIPTKWYDVYDVGKSVEEDLKAKGFTVRKVSGPDALVYNNEFKIALRVGTKPYYRNQITGERRYDYHFMRQTDTGQWAEKHGRTGPSERHKRGQTPTTISWDLDYLIGYYDSPIIYYAVGK